MNIKIFLKNGHQLDFLEQNLSTTDLDLLYTVAKTSRSPLIFYCTNGNFFIDTDNIAYMHIESDVQEPMEKE